MSADQNEKKSQECQGNNSNFFNTYVRRLEAGGGFAVIQRKNIVLTIMIFLKNILPYICTFVTCRRAAPYLGCHRIQKWLIWRCYKLVGKLEKSKKMKLVLPNNQTHESNKLHQHLRDWHYLACCSDNGKSKFRCKIKCYLLCGSLCRLVRLYLVGIVDKQLFKLRSYQLDLFENLDE